MSRPGGRSAPRAGILQAGLTAALLVVAAATPLVPGVRAVDPTPSASASPSDSPSASPAATPTTTPSPDPSPTPAPTPSPDPAPAPTATPTPSPSPSPSPAAATAPSETPAPTPAPSSSPSPSPSPSPIPTGKLSPGQRSGSDAASPIPVYKLVSPLATGASPVPAGGFVSPHNGYALTLTSDTCAICHAAHTAQAPNLNRQPLPVSNQCFTCHDGSGSSYDVKAEFSATGVKANDPSTDSYFQHPATVLDGHTLDSDNEFGGVSNRHSSCADCHQPHRADGTRPSASTGGWGASGAIVGASGVVVTNTPGAKPTYTFTATGLTFEYQLCLKCHSGFTVLPSNTGRPPSQWTLDKAVELDPLNATSYHPIEAAGTNHTTAMANSLSGTSTYKLWDFGVGDTIRCTNCHAGPTTPSAGTTADATLAPHASANRGILIANYRDRQLKAPTESYSASDFALCYACHAEAAFTQSTTTASLGATNFEGTTNAKYGATFQSLHALHLTRIAPQPSGGASTDIDTAGAGQGDAICAECHFRLHSTDQAYDSGDRSNSRLVNFAPDVTAAGSNPGPIWTTTGTPTGAGQGSCTLTCHGYTHQNVTYGP